jgi:hypothetical protein
MKQHPSGRDRISHDSDYLTLGCFIAAVLVVLIAIGFRVSYDLGLADKEPQQSSHLLI